MAASLTRTELRAVTRQKLNLELQFSYRRGKSTYFGTGRTTDFSEKAICFETDQDVPADAELELRIAWPATLGIYPLEMVIYGALVRKQNSLAVLLTRSFEFRTRGEGAFHSSASPGDLFSAFA